MDHFYQPEIANGNHTLDEEESRHCSRVLRKKVGDRIIVMDGKGLTCVCEITRSGSKKTDFEVIERNHHPPPAHHIELIIAPTKNLDRMEWLVEKTIEVGIQEISFLYCEHSERKKLNIDRIRKKSISAIKQSNVPFLPVINNIVPFETLLHQTKQSSEKYICHALEGRSSYLLNTAAKNAHYQVLVGPEGDFSTNELELAVQNGFRPVSLGENRLRTETAGVVACVLLNALNTQS